MDKNIFINQSIQELLAKYPFMETFLDDNHLSDFKNSTQSLQDSISSISDEDKEEWAIDADNLLSNAYDYYLQMKTLLGITDDEGVKSLSIIAGHNKSKEKESFGSFTINAGDIIAIVGPTGSGKSRLLADIEWTADRDTPTNRQIKVNGEVPDKKWRFSSGNKLVAQLSQNMNFVMDLTVFEFLELHATSRMINDIDDVINKIIAEANKLAGESFLLDTPITSLSGGQSRALMIADTAILSQSPIVLIDEIENAGIDRKKALDLLVSSDKIVLMATHDPILALMADKRIIIKNGGIADIIVTTKDEKAMLSELEKVDNFIQNKRAELRAGKELNIQDMKEII